MTVQVQTPEIRLVYSGPGSYDYDFQTPDLTTLKVQYIATDDVTTDLVLGTDYTVIYSTGSQSGSAEVTYDNPAGGPYEGTLKIYRETPADQQTDFINNDPLDMDILERAFDKLTMMIQEYNQLVGSVIVADPAIPDDVSLVVPIPGAGQFFKYTDDGKGIETADINELGTQIIPTMTDGEIIDGSGTQTRLISASQTKLAVTTHETAPLSSVFDVAWVEVVDTLPGTPNPNTMYLVRN